MSRIRTQELLPVDCNRTGRSSRAAPASRKTISLPDLVFIMMVSSSGTVRHAFAQQARGAQRQHDGQHDEGKDVGVLAAQYSPRELAEITGAQRFDPARLPMPPMTAATKAFRPGMKPMACCTVP